METNYKHIHRKVMHLLRKKKKVLNKKYQVAELLLFFFFKSFFIVWNSIRRTGDHTNFTGHLKNINPGFMRWNLRKLGTFMKTWNSHEKLICVFLLQTPLRVCLPEEHRHTWTQGREFRCRPSPRSPQQSIINQIFCSFFRQMRNFQALYIIHVYI